MSPSNLGVIASQISGHLWAPSGAYDSIATTTVGTGGASSITFSSIPSTYTHLQIRGIAQATLATGFIRFNSDSASNYATHYLYGDGASAASGAATNQTISYAFLATASANIFGGAVIDILDYTNTNKYKTMRSLSGGDQNGTGYIELISGLWQSTSAITSITLIPASGNFAQYSSFALYGIKGN